MHTACSGTGRRLTQAPLFCSITAKKLSLTSLDKLRRVFVGFQSGPTETHTDIGTSEYSVHLSHCFQMMDIDIP